MPHKMTSTSSSPITLVSVVIPVYNEAESLPELLRPARRSRRLLAGGKGGAVAARLAGFRPCLLRLLSFFSCISLLFPLSLSLFFGIFFLCSFSTFFMLYLSSSHPSVPPARPALSTAFSLLTPALCSSTNPVASKQVQGSTAAAAVMAL